MARGIIVPIVLPKGYDNDMAKVVFTTGDPVNGHMFRATGKEFIYAKSTGGPQSFTVLPGLDPYGRTGASLIGNLTNTNVDNVSQVLPVAGWVQPDGFIYINVSATFVVLAVIQIPDFPDGP